REESRERDRGGRVQLYAPLPFFAKFLGDGVLLLYELENQAMRAFCVKHKRNVERENQGDIWNAVSVLYDVCRRYRREFLTKFRGDFSRIPGRLRCGIAVWQICSIGKDSDFVGLC